MELSVAGKVSVPLRDAGWQITPSGDTKMPLAVEIDGVRFNSGEHSAWYSHDLSGNIWITFLREGKDDTVLGRFMLRSQDILEAVSLVYLRRLCENDAGKSATICIGGGRAGEGCGPSSQPSGGTCERCNGMVLSLPAIAYAAALAKSWEAEGANTLPPPETQGIP